jgi:hypothetical protein
MKMLYIVQHSQGTNSLPFYVCIKNKPFPGRRTALQPYQVTDFYLRDFIQILL